MFRFLTVLVLGYLAFHFFTALPTAPIVPAEDTSPTYPLPPPPEIVGISHIPSVDLLEWSKLQISRHGQHYRQIKRACTVDEVRLQAHSIIKPVNAGPFNIGMVADIYDHVLSRWNYIPDPVDDDRPLPASQIAQLCKGDCDDFAVYIATLIWSVGGEIRIVHASTYSGGHAYAQVNIGKTDLGIITSYLQQRYNMKGDIHVEKDRRGDYWLNLDYDLPNRHPGCTIIPSYQDVYFYPQHNMVEEKRQNIRR